MAQARSGHEAWRKRLKSSAPLSEKTDCRLGVDDPERSFTPVADADADEVERDTAASTPDTAEDDIGAWLLLDVAIGEPDPVNNRIGIFRRSIEGGVASEADRVELIVVGIWCGIDDAPSDAMRDLCAEVELAN